MATKLFLRAAVPDWGTGNNDAKLNGTAIGWTHRSLSTTRGASALDLVTNTVAGATNGVEVDGGGSTPLVWYSPPIDADVTISGSITWNIWGRESLAAANVAINGQIEKVDGATGAITLIDKTARTTEMAISASTNSVNAFSETPAAGVACKRGDRLRVRIFGDDAGTMGSGQTFAFNYDGPTNAANGDTYVTLTENLTFAAEPAGSQVFLTDTSSAVSTASVDREAWTSRGAGVQTDVVNTAAGWTAPIQVTDTAGGTVVDWFTRPLTAFTLGGAVRCNIRAAESASAANAGVRVEIARVAGDGTSPTVWASGGNPVELGTESAQSFLIAGDDLAISDGQRLRIRVYIDDYGVAAMGASQTATLYYAGTSGGASGDTYVTFTQTLTELSSGTTVTPDVAAVTASGVSPSQNIVVNLGVGEATATAYGNAGIPGTVALASAASVAAAAQAPSAKIVATSATAATSAAATAASDAITATAAVAPANAVGLDATVSVATATTVTASVATVTAAANAPSALVGAAAGAAASMAAGAAASDKVVATSTAAATTAAAYVAADLVKASPGLANASGTALGASTAIKATTDVSAVAATAYGATASTVTATTATATTAAVSATAHDADMVPVQVVLPGVAAVSATAYDADMTPSQVVLPGVAAVSAAANPATTAVKTYVDVAASSATAYNVAAQTAAGTTVQPGVAAATAAGHDADMLPAQAVTAGVAATTATAQGIQASVKATSGVAPAAAAANGALMQVAGATIVQPGTAATVAAAWGVQGSVIATAVLSQVSATAYAAVVPQATVASAGAAAATATAHGASPRVGAVAGRAQTVAQGHQLGSSAVLTAGQATALATAWGVDAGIGVRPGSAAVSTTALDMTASIVATLAEAEAIAEAWEAITIGKGFATRPFAHLSHTARPSSSVRSLGMSANAASRAPSGSVETLHPSSSSVRDRRPSS